MKRRQRRGSDWAIKEALDVLLEANLAEHRDAGGRIDFEHHSDVATGPVVASRRAVSDRRRVSRTSLLFMMAIQARRHGGRRRYLT
jgi:hypothetical protein